MALRSPYTSPSVRSPDFPFVRRLSNSSPTAGANRWFVWSGAVGSGTGVNWLNAFTTLASAIAASAAGDTFYLAHDHAETQASGLALAFKGTAANPDTVLCVSRFGSVPPVSADLRTTATLTTTGASSLTFQSGAVYIDGVIFSAANSTSNGSVTVNLSSAKLKNCALRLGGDNASSRISFNTVGNPVSIAFDNTTVQFANASQSIVLAGGLVWRNTASAITGATLPTILFTIASGISGVDVIEGVDLSALASGKTLVQPGATSTGGAIVALKDCKFGASVTVASTPTARGAKVVVVRADSGSTNYRAELYDYLGTQTVETTIVRTGGASDGTTPLSWKIVTTANSKWMLPFEALPIAIWNDTTGSLVTVTVEGIWGSTNLPQTDDIWFEIEGLGSAASPQGSFGTGSKADNLANGTVWATSSEVWGGSTTTFKMSATFTPQQKGALYIYVKAAKASTTFYIDPKVTLS